jgi:homogentisate 1,2-dioxygenase
MATVLHIKNTCTHSPGTLRIMTEFGLLDVSPCEVAVIGRGMRFAVELLPPRCAFQEKKRAKENAASVNNPARLSSGKSSHLGTVCV